MSRKSGNRFSEHARARTERAPAKINLSLRIIGRRADGYHEIESLVIFASVGDTLTFAARRTLALTVRGPTAASAGAVDDNLVLKAARALAERIEGIKLGRFVLSKRLPVAAGLGGGSADAAAALRLLAGANRLTSDDPRLLDAARVTGADVPVCLDPRPRIMRGIGEVLSQPMELPRLPAVLVNPRVAVPTKDVFARLNAARTAPAAASACLDDRLPVGRADLIAYLHNRTNDLEAPAVSLQPVISNVLADLHKLSGCRLARMSGSGATCFALFETAKAATAAAGVLRVRRGGWWVRATTLG